MENQFEQDPYSSDSSCDQESTRLNPLSNGRISVNYDDHLFRKDRPNRSQKCCLFFDECLFNNYSFFLLLLCSQVLYMVQFSSMVCLTVFTAMYEHEDFEEMKGIIRPIILAVEVAEVIMRLIEYFLECRHHVKTFQTCSFLCYLDDSVEEVFTYVLPVFIEGMIDVPRMVEVGIFGAIVVIMFFGFDNRIYRVCGFLYKVSEDNCLSFHHFEPNIPVWFDQSPKSLFSEFEGNLFYHNYQFEEVEDGRIKKNGVNGRLVVKRQRYRLTYLLPNLLVNSFLCLVSFFVFCFSLLVEIHAFPNSEVFFVLSFIGGISVLSYLKILGLQLEFMLENQKGLLFLISLPLGIVQTAALILLFFLPRIGVTVCSFLLVGCFLGFWIGFCIGGSKRLKTGEPRDSSSVRIAKCLERRKIYDHLVEEEREEFVLFWEENVFFCPAEDDKNRYAFEEVENGIWSQPHLHKDMKRIREKFKKQEFGME